MVLSGWDIWFVVSCGTIAFSRVYWTWPSTEIGRMKPVMIRWTMLSNNLKIVWGSWSQHDHFRSYVTSRITPIMDGALLILDLYRSPTPHVILHVQQPGIIKNSIDSARSSQHQYVIFPNRHLKLTIPRRWFLLRNRRSLPGHLIQIQHPDIVRSSQTLQRLLVPSKNHHLIPMHRRRMPRHRRRPKRQVMNRPTILRHIIQVQLFKQRAHLERRIGMPPSSKQHQHVMITHQTSSRLR